MPQKFKLKAEKRELTGRKVKNLRKNGILPANIFGKGVESTSIKFPLNEFEKVFRDAGETSIIEISVDNDIRPVLVHEVQTDPVTDLLIHVDFFQVDLKEKVKASVPIEIVGESPAEKQGLGTAVQYLDEMEVSALPTDLPEKFEVSIDNLEEVNDAVFVKDLKVMDKVEILADKEEVLVKVEPPREEEEEPVPTEEVEGLGDAEIEGETGETLEADKEPEAEEGSQEETEASGENKDKS